MKKIITLIVSVAIAAIVFIMAHPNEKKRVIKQLHNLCESVEKQPEEGNLAAGAKNLAFGKLLADSVTIQINEFPYNGAHTSSEISSLTAQGRMYCKKINLDIKSAEVDLSDGLAMLHTTIAFKIATKFNVAYDEIRPFVFQLVKVDKSWLFKDFQDEQILKK